MKKKTKKAKRSFDHRVVKKKPDQTLASPPPEMKKKMKKKAKRSFDHRVVASTAGCADLGDGKVKSSTDYGQPVYLVWPLLSGQPTFSVFMVEAAAALADGADPPRARTVAGIPGARRGMSFVATHSVQGSWIVGVGGKEGNTVIYDPSAMKTFEGPELSYPKHQPILISLDSKVYAISRRPTVYDKKYDFVPWFESLSFKKGVPGISGEKFSFWKALPPPPFFPFMLDPLEYCNPPTVSVSSYAAFGSHILLSPDCKETGTYAFHVVEETWEKVCNNNMPFVGQAVALGGGLFAACSTIHNNFATAAIVFRMSIIKGSSIPGASVKLIVRSLSTLPLASMGDPPLPLLCPAGKGSFCSIKLGQGFCEGKDHVQIILTAFKIDNIEAVLTASQTEHADASVLQLPVEVHHQNQTYLLEAPFPFKNPCMPVIALLSMDRELAEPFEVERSKKKAREWFSLWRVG